MQKLSTLSLICVMGVLANSGVVLLAEAEEAQPASGQAFPAMAEAPASTASPATSHAAITRDELASAVERYIMRESEIQNGHFLFFDKENNQPLALTFQGVDKDKIQRQMENLYIAVTWMETQEKQTVLLDIFMKYMGNDQLKVTEVKRHKEQESKPEYQWDDASKDWKKM